LLLIFGSGQSRTEEIIPKFAAMETDAESARGDAKFK
jgi:hypothetical protein